MIKEIMNFENIPGFKKYTNFENVRQLKKYSQILKKIVYPNPSVGAGLVLASCSGD